jgi:hypothetical protein
VPRKARFLLLTLAVFLVIAAGLVIFAYLFLPPLLERAASARLQEQFGLQERPRVDLQGEPPPSGPGSFSGGRIEMRGAEFDGVRTNETVIGLDPFELDLAGSLAAGGLRTEGPVFGTLRAELSEAEVSRLARQQANVPVRSVSLEEGEVVVGSVARVMGFDVPLSARGSVLLRGGEIVFEPRRLSASGVELPEELSEELLAGTSFAFGTEELPYGARLMGVEAREGRLVLSGEIEEIPLRSGG